MNWWLARRSRGKFTFPIYFECAGRPWEAHSIGGLGLGLKSNYSVLPVNPPPANLKLFCERSGHKFYWEPGKL